MVWNSKIRATILATLCGVLTIALVTSFLVQRTAQKTLDELASDTASHWASHLAETLPGIRNIVQGHPPSWQAREILEQTRNAGDVFRYKIFDAQGELVLVSDNPYFRLDDNANLNEHNPMAAQVPITGETYIQVQQGDGETRPEYYSEAYVPIVIGDETIGIMEVYIDQTHLREGLISTLSELSLLTFLAMIAAFGIPTLGFVWLTHLHDKATTQLDHASRHDGLTGVRTRATFKADVEHMMADGHDVTIYALDFDHFKAINDAHGQHVGDEVLRQAGERLVELVGDIGFIGRPSGDEFAVCRKIGQQTPEDCIRFTKAIQNTVKQPFLVDELSIVCSCSVGFASSIAHGDSAAILIHQATVALDQSKREGRNRVICYAEAIETMRKDRLNLESLLRETVRDDQFTLHYQPQFDTLSTRLTGFEALIRLNDRDGTSISPEKFVPVAEEMGLINKLGGWVLRTACTYAALWPDDLTIAVNLSAIQFENGKLVDTVKDILQDTGLPPQRLELEITESLLIDDTANVISQLHELRALGIKIALDDFGTGYSSLSYLWKFPFDRLKIDRSFVQQIEESNGKAFDILHSIVSLSQALNLHITAEGVETLKQIDVLREMGASQVQGFLLGRPMPEVDVPALILSKNKPALAASNQVEGDRAKETQTKKTQAKKSQIENSQVESDHADSDHAEIANRVSLVS